MLEILRASVDDSEMIAACTRDAYSCEMSKYVGEGKISERPTSNEVQHDMENHTYYKIMLDDTIIGGVIIMEEDEQTVSIQDFCIAPPYQNRGYGKLVLSELERLHNDIPRWVLTTPVYSVGNQHLYEKQGYKKVKIGDFGGTLCVYYEKYRM